MGDEPGLIYLIHFAKPYQHAQHYLGFVRGDLQRRLKNHRTSTLESPADEGKVTWKRHRAVKLLAAVNDAGIPWAVVSVRAGSIKEERQAHRNGNNRKQCPICQIPTGEGCVPDNG